MIQIEHHIKEKIATLFKDEFGFLPNSIIKLPNSGSNRIYYRLISDKISVLGAYNSDKEENIAFIDFTKQFIKYQINVPEIIAEDLTQNVYLTSDLGDTTLLEWLLKVRSTNHFPINAIDIYKKALSKLARMQIVAGENFNYDHSYPFKEFDKKAILFDLKYFQDNFLINLKIDYNSTSLDLEFKLFSDHLLSADNKYFMFRDFQARNIMLVNNEPYFIDYQGGRKGALQYDLVSLLFQAKAQIPEKIKKELLEHYIDVAQSYTQINKSEFIKYYYGFALIRVLQTLGAYGLRGIIEKKPHFLESIPLAINNLKYLYDKTEILNKLPQLKLIIDKIINTNIDNKQLYVNSFNK
jgi:aminoglycoside/choline kinase family phosphotransferase